MTPSARLPGASAPRALFHGGVSGLRRGAVILPNAAEHRYVEGCAHCEAQRRGEETEIDPPTPPDWVYGTTNRRYARYYASRAVEGDLYKVRLLGDVERSTEDPFPTWRAGSAEVIKVVERKIILTMRERKHIFMLWGGNDLEFRGMMAAAREMADA